ncbi:DUF599 domain-containing protein [Paragemmobacter ruber]|uniref:DUF599 family protein n=1 Tax=Paragemmobacter ruber TaxID=1985673 RepID=A0ABW9Y4Z3_9RHOB|nr:DUF599 domain-containing protein [Rhodobacter ruber]NBE07637.1 DUF599 family protein [Rhodobacter ruber]
MTIPFHIGTLTGPDMIAVGLYVLLWVACGWIIENPPARLPSVSVLMKQYRRDWMAEFVTRQPRIFDATLIDSLRQGTAFFASACMIAIGGGVALIGNSERVEGLAADLTLGQAGPQIEMKMILVIAFLANALLKFVWAHRLFGYCSILMGAVPNNPADPKALPRAAQAAEINITGARSFNRGLRSIYFALGALGWLFGPYGLALAGCAAAAVLMRREFASHSRDVMLRG